MGFSFRRNIESGPKRASRRAFAALLIAAVAALLCSAADAQQPRRPAGERRQQQPPPAATSPQTTKLDPGTLTSTSYTNKFFGVEVPIPRGWFAHDQATREQIMEKGKEIVRPGDPQKQLEMDAAVNRTVILLTMSKLVGSGSAPPRAVFQLIAEQIPPGTTIKTGNQYLFNVLAVLQYSKVPYEIEENVHQELVGGKEFSAASVRVTFPTGVLRQKYYAAVERGYGLTIGLTYGTEDDLKALEEVLTAVEFRRP